MSSSRAFLAARYLAGLPRFLRNTLSVEECRRMLVSRLRERREAFLSVLENAVYNHPASPYRTLLVHAGIPWERASDWVRSEGVEATLARFYDAGVYIGLEEFKGSTPVRRSGLEIAVAPEDFDNPLLAAGYTVTTGGSRSRGNPVIIDHGLLEHESAYDCLTLMSLGALERPHAVWRPVPPGVAGIKDVLRHAKHGHPVERWFSPTALRLGRSGWPYGLFTWGVLTVGRLAGRPLPRPEHTPLGEPLPVALWLASARARGTPGLLDSASSSAVRVCLAARDIGADIAGSVFRIGGEPHTPARDRVIRSVGCRAFPRYSMSESGNLGLPCALPEAVDDVHVVTDRVAVLQCDRRATSAAARVGALHFTTLRPDSPKIMINVDSGDYGTLVERSCGCLLGELGLSLHLHGIRSYDKLTTGGMNFLGGELIRVLEEILPSRFGGAPTDYQLVEEEQPDGLPLIRLVVHPRLGEIDSRRIVEVVLGALAKGTAAKRMMAHYWRDGEMLRVLRREPYATKAAKILPLHLIRREPGES
jgi:hypothetical protein